MNHVGQIAATRPMAWRVIDWMLMAAFLLTAALNMRHVRAGLLTNSVAEVVRPAVTFPRAPLRLGKTEAEKVVYAVTIAAWLLLAWIQDVSAPEPAVEDGVAIAALVLVVLPVKVNQSNRSSRSRHEA